MKSFTDLLSVHVFSDPPQDFGDIVWLYLQVLANVLFAILALVIWVLGHVLIITILASIVMSPFLYPMFRDWMRQKRSQPSDIS